MKQLAPPQRKSLLKRASVFGFAFFLLKGIAWLVIAAAAASFGAG